MAIFYLFYLLEGTSPLFEYESTEKRENLQGTLSNFFKIICVRTIEIKRKDSTNLYKL